MIPQLFYNKSCDVNIRTEASNEAIHHQTESHTVSGVLRTVLVCFYKALHDVNTYPIRGRGTEGLKLVLIHMLF